MVIRVLVFSTTYNSIYSGIAPLWDHEGGISTRCLDSLSFSAGRQPQVDHSARKTTRNHHRKLHGKNYIAYFNGCAREGDFPNAIMENVATLVKYFVDYRICVYAMDAAADTFAKFNDPKMTIICKSQQSSPEASSPHRTERLAYGV